MVRQLLALLALLTGFAALGAPVHASMNHAVNATVQQAEARDADNREAPETCADRQRRQKLRGEKVTPCRAQEPVTIYIPAVMFGADRAFE